MFQARGFKVNLKNMDLLNMGPGYGAHFMGRFLNGQVVGHFWIGLINNGYIHGVANEEGLATGDDIVFIYPDGETALRGKFENRYMKKARNVNVKNYGCDENGMFIPTEFSEPLSDYEYSYDPCTNESFGGVSKFIPDPYELKTVKLMSSALPNSGEGVMLQRDVPFGRPACFYSLYLYREPDQVDLYQESCCENKKKSDHYRRECKKYSLGLRSYDATIDLPPELDVNPLPNLGPKVNHHFKEHNSNYMETEHPRWGLIQSVTPFVDMKAGEELFTFYGYGIKAKFPADFPWYWEAKMKIDREERLQKEALEKQKAEKKKNKKNKSKIKDKKSVKP